MKKLIISITIAMMSLSLVGCNNQNSFETNDTNQKIDELQTTIDNLEEKINELSSKVDSWVLTLKPYENSEETSVKISKSYLPNLEDYNEMIESLKEKFKAEGKTIIYPEKAIGERVIILETSDLIRNVTLNEFDNSFYNEFGGIESLYFSEYGIENKGNLTTELSLNQVLVFTAKEPEGPPSHYISWTEKDGTTLYTSITYDGRGAMDKLQ